MIKEQEGGFIQLAMLRFIYVPETNQPPFLKSSATAPLSASVKPRGSIRA